MASDRRSRDLGITLAAVVIAIACAVALSVGMAMRPSRGGAGGPYPPPGSGMIGSGMMGPGMMGTPRSPAVPSCAATPLAGTVVDVTFTDMHGMMGPGMRGPGMMGMMRIVVNPATVPPGQVSFRVTNAGALNHELVVLPLAKGQYPGQRAIGSDGKADETGSVAEASRTCGADRGEENQNAMGIAPGASGWTTVTLTPGRYELICNISGHYWTGMYTELDVSPAQ